jgi:AbiU2
MIARVEPDEQIPEKFREIYSHLAGKLIQTHGAFEELMLLFGTKEVVNVLNATAPAFFVRHERLLVDSIVLSLSRMTDEKSSGSGRNRQQNLTLGRLLELPDTQSQQLRQELAKKWTKIRKIAEQLRPYRHKFLAHSDLAQHLSRSTKLATNISIGLIKKLLEQINDFLNTFDYFFTSIETTYRAPASYGDASDLIAYLNLAIDTENKTKGEILKAVGKAPTT